MSQTVIITGASDGIGAAAARQLAARGERIVVIGRSPEKTAAVAKSIGAPHHLADFTDLAQVEHLAETLLAAYPRIDVLANNAGGLFTRETTKDGYDKTFQVNHLAPFLLTHRLLDRLIESKAKVIQTSSIGAKLMGRIELEDYLSKTPKAPFKAYGDSKLANQLFTKELDRRFHARGLSAVSFHPGNIASSFGTTSVGFIRLMLKSKVVRKLMLESPEKGGSRLAWLALGAPGQTWRSGAYYENNRLPPARKINPQADDPTLARALWDRSEQLLGLTPRG